MYLSNLIISHEIYSMLSILNEIALQKEWQNLVTNYQKSKNKTNKLKNPCLTWDSNPVPLDCSASVTISH